jgi:enterochelin esterase family protein
MSRRTTEHSISSGFLNEPRRVWVHHDESGRAKDCVLWMDGEIYSGRVKAPALVAAAIASGALPALTCVYLPNDTQIGRHAAYTCTESFASFLALEMPRWIEREAGPFERLYLCGLSLSGLQALFTALRFPGVFAGALAQSPSAWWNDERLASAQASFAPGPQRFWISVGTKELKEDLHHPPTALHQKTSQLASVRRLSRAMSEAGHDVHHHEFEGGHDPARWGGELTEALGWLMMGRAPE